MMKNLVYFKRWWSSVSMDSNTFCLWEHSPHSFFQPGPHSDVFSWSSAVPWIPFSTSKILGSSHCPCYAWLHIWKFSACGMPFHSLSKSKSWIPSLRGTPSICLQAQMFDSMLSPFPIWNYSCFGRQELGDWCYGPSLGGTCLHPLQFSLDSLPKWDGWNG